MTRPTFADTLRKARLQRQWSQNYLASRLKTTRVTISRWEHGISLPSPLFQQALTKLLGISFAPEKSLASLSSTQLPSKLPEPVPEETVQRDYRQSLEQRGALDPAERRMILQLKRLRYILEQIELLLPHLTSEVTQNTRIRILELLFQQIEGIQQEAHQEFLLPSFAQIQQAVATAQQEQHETVQHQPSRLLSSTFLPLKEFTSILRHQDNLYVLGQSALADLICVRMRLEPTMTSPMVKGRVVQQILHEALAQLEGTGVRSDEAREWMDYNILHYRYFQSRRYLSQRQIATRLMISERQYYRELIQAQRRLWETVMEKEAQTALQAPPSFHVARSEERSSQGEERRDGAR